MQRMKDLFKPIRAEGKLDDYLLYLDFWNNRQDLPVVLLKDRSVMVLFELAGVDYEGLSEEEKSLFAHYLRSGLEQLPDEGLGFRVQNYLVRDRAQLVPLVNHAEAPEVIRFVQDKKMEFWREVGARSYQNRVVCGLRYYTPKKLKPSLRQLWTEEKRHDLERGVIDERVEKLLAGVEALKSGLGRFGFRVIDRSETFRTLYRMVNLSDPGPYRADLSLNVQLAASSWTFHPETQAVQIGDTYRSFIGLKYPPAESVALYLRRLYELEMPLVLRQSVQFADTNLLFQKQDSARNIAQALSGVDKTCGLYVQEVSAFQERVQSEKELAVYWAMQIAVEAASIQELKDAQGKVLTVLKEIGASGQVESTNLKYGAFAMLPGHEDEYGREALITTANLGDLFSAFTLNMGDADPVDYFGDRLNGVFAFNPFTDRENAHHMAITGPTGSGKSFAVNRMILSMLVENPRIYVIDLSQSFSEVFGLLEQEMPGSTGIMRISKTHTDFRFNPFLLEDPDAPVPEHQLNFCLGLLKLMVGRDRITPDNEYSLLECLKLFFKDYGKLCKVGSPPPPLDHLADILETEGNERTLANAVKLWCQGRKGEIFNSGQDTLTSAQYVYFDLRDLEGEDDLMSVLVYCIFAKVYADVETPDTRSVKKMLFLDEAHRYLRHDEFSFWIELLFRTGRHYRLLMGVITQSINDLIVPDASWSKGIVENLKQAMFFGGQKDVKEAFGRFQMTTYHTELYKKLKPDKRELLYWSSGGLRRVLRPITDPYTYWLATTDPTERSLRDRIRTAVGGDIKQAIQVCVEQTRYAVERKERTKALTNWLEQHQAESLREVRA